MHSPRIKKLPSSFKTFIGTPFYPTTIKQMSKKCCKLKDLKQHYNDQMAKEGDSRFGQMLFRFEYFSGSFAFLSAVVTTLAILHQYIFIQRMTLTEAIPYPMWLEGTCTCNGTLCPGVVFTMNFTTPQFCEGSGAGLCKGLLGESQKGRKPSVIQSAKPYIL